MDMMRLTGVFAALWMIVGVGLVARRFPGYSHRDRVMSELGAAGRPSAGIHPVVNNFPLAALYAVFGATLCVDFQGNAVMVATGLLILVHGICHAVTGLFHCDADLGVSSPSVTQKIHNIAGLVMFLSLYAASIAGLFAPPAVAPVWFSGFSLACLAVSLIFLIFMARALPSERNVGLYQRLSYGALVLWVAVLSGVVYQYA